MTAVILTAYGVNLTGGILPTFWACMEPISSHCGSVVVHCSFCGMLLCRATLSGHSTMVFQSPTMMFS